MSDDLEQLTYAGRLIPQAIRRWADRVIRDAVAAWEEAHECWGDECDE